MFEPLVDTVKTELSKESISSRLSIKTIGDGWKKVKDVAEVVWSISSSALAIMGLIAGVPPLAITIVSGIVAVSGTIWGRARLDNSKKIN